MTVLYEAPSWSLVLPDDFAGDAGEHCHTFCADDGVGALQISSAHKQDGEIRADELQEFACDGLPNGNPPTTVTCGDFRSGEYVDGDAFCRKLWVCNGTLLLFVTYNCAVDDRPRENDTVNAILDTLMARS